MIFLEPARTPYDLTWRMLGTQVRVSPWFWLVAALMGYSLLRVSIQLFLVWVACMFVSILIHELGHVMMFRVFGVQADTILYAFGGLAVPRRALHNRWQRIAVSFAGPFAGFLLVGVLLLGTLLTNANRELEFDELLHPGVPVLVGEAVNFLIIINLFWGFLNLVPIWPLDGGQISRDFLDFCLPGGKGLRLAFGISFLLAALLAIHCMMAANGHTLIPFLPGLGGTYSALMFAMLAVQNYQMLQQESQRPWRRDDW